MSMLVLWVEAMASTDDSTRYFNQQTNIDIFIAVRIWNVLWPYSAYVFPELQDESKDPVHL
jgi:hypothetical protein